MYIGFLFLNSGCKTYTVSENMGGYVCKETSIHISWRG